MQRAVDAVVLLLARGLFERWVYYVVHTESDLPCRNSHHAHPSLGFRHGDRGEREDRTTSVVVEFPCMKWGRSYQFLDQVLEYALHDMGGPAAATA